MIGFFDSGLGGLTVLKEAIENENLKGKIVYLGDTKNTPYGTKNDVDVKGYIMDCVEQLVNRGCNPIVVACNTATSLCIKELRDKYKNITFIGTEPAVKVASDEIDHKEILVLATSITVKKEKLHDLIKKLEVLEHVKLKAADKLVLFAEETSCNEDELENYLVELLEEYDLTKISHIVLGCTHFPLFKDNIQKVVKRICPDAEIKIVDGAKGISKNLMNNLSKEDLQEENIKIEILTTSYSSCFNERAAQILGNYEINFESKLH